jgi:hypothetical protein
MTTMLSLNVYVLGIDGPPFPVHIDDSLLVGDLKDEIQKKRSTKLPGDAADLTLYKVAISSEGDLATTAKDEIFKLKAKEKEDATKEFKSALNSLRKLSKVFKDPPAEEIIHIVVERPQPDGKSSAALSQQLNSIRALFLFPSCISKHCVFTE